MSGRALALVGLLAAFAAHAAGAQRNRVTIAVRVDSQGIVHVQEHYRVDGGEATFRALQRTCASIGDVEVARDGGSRFMPPMPRGPWLEYEDASGARTPSSSETSIGYAVVVTGREGDVPLVHLARPIAGNDEQNDGAVAITVRFPPGREGRVTFPHLVRSTSGDWSGHFVAIPAFLHVNGLRASGDRCAAPAGEPNDGGLRWRFWLLVAIMATWVPLYLVWARRSDGRDA